MRKGLFVTGTGTDVGKTYVTGLLVKTLQDCGAHSAYFKAATSGNERDVRGQLVPGDALYVKEQSGIDQPLDSMCPYLYEAAVSPHLASMMEGTPLMLSHVLRCYDVLCTSYDYVTLEGAGGIVCPLRFDDQKILQEDFIKARPMNVVLVADAGLGTINAVVLSVEYMVERDISVKGMIFNRFEPGNRLHEDNVKMCECLTGVPTLACVKEGDTTLAMSCDTLAMLYE